MMSNISMHASRALLRTSALRALPMHVSGRLEHEYSLAIELDSAWAARPLALTRQEGRTILVLTDPDGELLDRVLERDQAQNRIAGGLR
jgi:hypothetical protein